MTQLAVLLALLPTATALGLQGWLLRNGGNVGLLGAQPLSSLLLPGEMRQFHCGQGRARDALHRAVENDFGVVAMQLETPAGNVPVIAPLLEVSKLSDCGQEGTFVEVRCVGRARMRDVHRDGRASVSPFRDARCRLDADESTDAAIAAVQRVKELHASCHALDLQLRQTEAVAEEAQAWRALEMQELSPGVRKLEEGAAGGAPPPRGANRLARPAASFVRGLDELMDSRRSTLLAQAAAEGMYEPSLERLPLWHESRRWGSPVGPLSVPGGLWPELSPPEGASQKGGSVGLRRSMSLFIRPGLSWTQISHL